MMINNFTEFYNLLKAHDVLANTVPGLKNYILLVESYKAMCSCNRKDEKIRLKLECESQYRILINSTVTSNINVFFTTLNQSKISFANNNVLIKSFGS